MVAQFISTNFSDDLKSECAEVLSQVSLALTKVANSQYKTRVYIEPREVERVKAELKTFICDDARVNNFKSELMNDLENFQKDIAQLHIEKIKEYTRLKATYEGNIKILEKEKNKIIFDKLSKIEWPYTPRTKQIDALIAHRQAQILSVNQKLEKLQSTRAEATEKDILLYKMRLKEKYSLR